MFFVMHIVVTTGMLNINPEPRSKMPTKFKPTQKTVARGTGKVSVTHYYMKSTPLKELIEEYNRITGDFEILDWQKKELDKRRKKYLCKCPRNLTTMLLGCWSNV